jgi:hypothetical protein
MPVHRKTKDFKMKRSTIIFVVLILIAVGGWYGLKEYLRKNVDLENVSAKITTDAPSLITAFEKDSSEANKKYLGKIIAVTGIVKSIEKEDGATLVLANAGNMSSVRCSMDTTHLADIASVKEGQAVKVKGVCTGYTADEMGIGADVILNRCVLEKNNYYK